MSSEVYHLSDGTVLHGRYEVICVLGFGGFGVVYKAYDKKLQRIVAIKEYFPTIYLSRDVGCTDAVVFDRKNVPLFQKGKEAFLQEARNMAKYNTHPNIVHVYDFFEENQTAYFVMEYMDGHNLNEYINQARQEGKVLTVQSAVHITKEILCALKETHASGIIHRDIKPHNIYILKTGEVKLIDFGAARFSDAELEQKRTIIITPGYAPPEQYQTKSKQGAFTDIYALGAVLYEMLTGIRPEESINRKVEDTVEAPSKYNSKVSEALDSIIMRAIAIQPEIRFKSAEEFLKALEIGKKVRNADREVRHRIHRRNRVIFIVVVIVLGVVGYAGWGVYRNYRSAILASTTLQIWVPELEGDELLTEQIYQEMSEEFIENNPQVTLQYTVIPLADYQDTLKMALAENRGPDIFDSTALSSDEKQYFADIKEVYEDQNFDISQYYFLDTYRDLFTEERKLPLLLDLPVVYEVSGENGLSDSNDYQGFVNKKNNYMGSVLDYDMVQEDMTGNFEIRENWDTERTGVFLNYWSINIESDQAKKDAGARLIHYFLSDNAQEVLAVDNGLGLPVNKNVWDVYMEINNVFSYLTDFVVDMKINK